MLDDCYDPSPNVDSICSAGPLCACSMCYKTEGNDTSELMQAATPAPQSCTDPSLSVDAICSAVSSCADAMSVVKNETEISITSFRDSAAASISHQLNGLPICVDAMSQDNGDDTILVSAYLLDFSSKYHDAAINERLCGKALCTAKSIYAHAMDDISELENAHAAMLHISFEDTMFFASLRISAIGQAMTFCNEAIQIIDESRAVSALPTPRNANMGACFWSSFGLNFFFEQG